jgi:hypothetical protein
MPVKRYCGDCGRELLPEEDGCPKCGTFHILEPTTIRIGDDGKFQAKTKFISRNKISNHGKEAKEHFRFDITGNRKIHHVVEKDSNGDWQTVHDENVPLAKKKRKR